MRKNLVLTMLMLAIVFGSAHVLAQEADFTPGPAVKEEQKLMVRIRLEIADGRMIHYEEQDGIMIYPQTVLTTLSPLMILGARTLVIDRSGEKIPAVKLTWDLQAGLMVLALIRPLQVGNLDLSVFLGIADGSDNLFVLSSLRVLSASQKEDEQTRGGDILVDSCGRLVAMLLKDASGRLPEVKISREEVSEFFRFFSQGPPIPQLPNEDERTIEMGIHGI